MQEKRGPNRWIHNFNVYVQNKGDLNPLGLIPRRPVQNIISKTGQPVGLLSLLLFNFLCYLMCFLRIELLAAGNGAGGEWPTSATGGCLDNAGRKSQHPTTILLFKFDCLVPGPPIFQWSSKQIERQSMVCLLNQYLKIIDLIWLIDLVITSIIITFLISWSDDFFVLFHQHFLTTNAHTIHNTTVSPISFFAPSKLISNFLLQSNKLVAMVMVVVVVVCKWPPFSLSLFPGFSQTFFSFSFFSIGYHLVFGWFFFH